MVAEVRWKEPTPEDWDRHHQRVVLQRGAAGWLHMRVLPRTAHGGITMAIHALLALPSLRQILQRLSMWVEGPMEEVEVTVDTMSTILAQLI